MHVAEPESTRLAPAGGLSGRVALATAARFPGGTVSARETLRPTALTGAARATLATAPFAGVSSSAGESISPRTPTGTARVDAERAVLAPAPFAGVSPSAFEPVSPTAPTGAARENAERVGRPSPEHFSRERALGRGLALMRGGQLCRPLGFGRLGDYVLERLGMSTRTVQELMRTSEALASLPVTAAALERGEIKEGHARLLTRVATATDEAMWVARARKMSVRGLARAVAVVRREADVADAADTMAAGPDAGSRFDGGAAAGDGVGVHHAAELLDPEPELPLLEVVAPAWIASLWREVKVIIRRLSGGLLPAGVCLEVLLAEAADGGWRPGASPGDAADSSAPEGGLGDEDRTASTLDERLAGSPGLPSSSAGDGLPASAPGASSGDEPNASARDLGLGDDHRTASTRHHDLAGSPGLPTSSAGEGLPASAPGASEMECSAGEGGYGELESRVTTPALADDGRGGESETRVTASAPMNDGRAGYHGVQATTLAPFSPAGDEPAAQSRSADASPTPLDFPDASDLDRELRELATARQRDEAHLADHLAECRRWRTFRAAGFESLEAFALERFSLSPRRLYYLLALHRDLDRLPPLRKAFVSGRVTLRQTLLIAKVGTLATAEAWIRRAEAVTLRRLEDEVEFWQHLRDTRNEIWRRLRGRPLPEGIVLVPGHVPRLHASAGSAVSNERPEDVNAKLGLDLPPSAHDTQPLERAERPSGRPEDPSVDSESDPHPFSFHETVTARTFLAALEADEALTPLPERRCRIRMRVEQDVLNQWTEKAAALRASVRPDLAEWEVLALLMRDFLAVWDNQETRRQAREHPTLERDGWRCTAPGCRAFGSGRLHEHHIILKSHGGAVKDPTNVTSLCAVHHALLHHGRIRCTGRAPDELLWEMGVEPGKEPFQVFAGDVLVH